ncbi:hypothetical protein SAMN04487928_11268 [Butyrivibrio proteoclasticus]|uniref:Uncharacterized protein n=1 Tax=Butyrivibrio proteoclasticus TaxID=43305 RepID=A0A1I5UDS2_9FIRM|nr:hypothetical protein [Butyrivibrio proteoclasticus]SFP93358.1 hypothetical protein SAMN04487928_11268 [Butyrivibrio proteoclasticus]
MKKIRVSLAIMLVATMLIGVYTTAFASGSVDGIVVGKEYSATFDDGNMYLLVEVTNTNSVDTAVSMDAISIDASGKVMETNAEDDVFILAPGEIYMLVGVFPNSASATNYDYDLFVNRKLGEYGVKAAGSSLDAKAYDAGNGNVEVYVTNTSSETVSGSAVVVYYYKNEIVDFAESYLGNTGDYLKAGEKTTAYFHTNQVYDSFSYYIAGMK